MKKILIAAMLSIGCFAATPSEAQVNVSVNIGSQPAWAPVGYDYVNYYYMPDIESYYDVNRQVYVFSDGRRWVTSRALPRQYGNYNIYNGYKVVLNGVRDPWMRHNAYRQQYMGFRGRQSQQVVIRDARDQRYWQNPGNRNYGQWKKQYGYRGGRGNQNNVYYRY